MNTWYLIEIFEHGHLLLVHLELSTSTLTCNLWGMKYAFNCYEIKIGWLVSWLTLALLKKIKNKNKQPWEPMIKKGKQFTWLRYEWLV